MEEKKNIIVELTIEFSIGIIRLNEELVKQKKFDLARQLFRSGTSIGANVREAQNAESRADFIHKMKIAAKEAEETDYWLLLLIEAYDDKRAVELKEKLLSISKVLTKIIFSSKK